MLPGANPLRIRFEVAGPTGRACDMSSTIAQR
jgi:hypothetical protein